MKHEITEVAIVTEGEKKGYLKFCISGDRNEEFFLSADALIDATKGCWNCKHNDEPAWDGPCVSCTRWSGDATGDFWSQKSKTAK